MAFNLFTSIDAASGTGPGEALSVSDVHDFAVQVTTTGSPTGLDVDLEGSLDAVNWFVIASFSLNGGSTAGDIDFATDKPVPFIRANCTSLTGGTAPTITAIIYGA